MEATNWVVRSGGYELGGEEWRLRTGWVVRSGGYELGGEEWRLRTGW